MVRDDIIAQRQERQRARAQQLLRQAQLEAGNRREARQKFTAWCVAAGFVLFVAYLASRLF